LTVARQTIAAITTFGKSNEHSLERRAGAYQSSKKRNALFMREFRTWRLISVEEQYWLVDLPSTDCRMGSESR